MKCPVCETFDLPEDAKCCQICNRFCCDDCLLAADNGGYECSDCIAENWGMAGRNEADELEVYIEAY